MFYKKKKKDFHRERRVDEDIGDFFQVLFRHDKPERIENA